MNKYLCSIMLVLFAGISAMAETWDGEPDCSTSPTSCHYIMDGASGAADGSSWTDAWDDITDATFTRGHVYFVADGYYTGRDFNTAASGTTYIYVKKAVSSDHGTDTGWSSSYGDGQAILDTTTISVLTDYWIFDGQNGTIADGDDSSAYGFLMKQDSCTDAVRLFGIPNIGDHAYDPDYVTVAHWAFDLPGVSYSSYVQIAIYGNQIAGANIADHIRIYRCYFLDSHTHILHNGNTNMVIEENFFSTLHDNTNHEQHFATNNADNMIVRNNFFYHPLLYVWGAHGELGGTTNSDDVFYGNVVVCSSSLSMNSIFGNADSGTTDVIDNMTVAHNTFVNCSPTRGAAFVGTISAGGVSYAYNNLHITSTGAYYNNNEGMGFDPDNVVHDYNAYYDSTSLESETNRIDLASNPLDSGYKPTIAVGAGKTDLGSSYSPDPDGVTRGSDGVYDPGAYEYTSGSPTPTPTPTPGIKTPITRATGGQPVRMCSGCAVR